MLSFFTINLFLSMWVGGILLRNNMLENGSDYTGLLVIIPMALFGLVLVSYDIFTVIFISKQQPNIFYTSNPSLFCA
ncbi:MAG: hypothetical protein PHX34_04435 [Candidatus Shapirobacteria bacterium]|nr:hypothetical protein [Candidatus Shapirobacteria bacterium]